MKKVRDIVEFIDINYNSNYNSKFGRLIAQTASIPPSLYLFPLRNIMNIDKLK